MSIKKGNLTKLFLELAQIKEDGVSRYVCTDEFIDKYKDLQLGNGGSWCRFDGIFGKKYKVITIKNNGKINFSWNDDNEKKPSVNLFIKKNKKDIKEELKEEKDIIEEPDRKSVV
jgi:hypothetical protein